MIPAVCNEEMMGSAAGTARHPRVIHKSGGRVTVLGLNTS